MTFSRSADRDVFLFTTHDLQQEFGGLVLTEGITNQLLYSMVNILVLEQSAIVIKTEHGDELPKSNAALQPGKYYVHGILTPSLRSFV